MLNLFIDKFIITSAKKTVKSGSVKKGVKKGLKEGAEELTDSVKDAA